MDMLKKLGKSRCVSILLALSLAVGLLISAFPAQAADYRLNKTAQTLYVGESCQLLVRGVAASKVTWTTNKPKIVTVNKKGMVTAKKKGTAKVIAKVGNVKLVCRFTVKPMGFAKKVYTMKTTSIFNLILRSGAKGGIAWSTSDSSKLRVRAASGDHVLLQSFGKPGVVTVKAVYRGRTFTCRMQITARPTPTPTPLPTPIPTATPVPTATPTPIVRAPYVPKITECKVTGLENPIKFEKNVPHPFYPIGASAEDYYRSLVEGDGKWVPVYWCLSASPTATHEMKFQIVAKADIHQEISQTIYVYFELYEYHSNGWISTGNVSSYPVTFHTMAW